MNIKPQSTREWVVIIGGATATAAFLLWMFVIVPGTDKLENDRKIVTDMRKEMEDAQKKATRKQELMLQFRRMGQTYSNLFDRIADVEVPEKIDDVLRREFVNIDRLYGSNIKRTEFGKIQTNGMHKTWNFQLQNVECGWRSLNAALYLIENSGQLIGFDSLTVGIQDESDKRNIKNKAQMRVTSFIFPDKGGKAWHKPDYELWAEGIGRDIFRLPEGMIPVQPTNDNRKGPEIPKGQKPPWMNLLKLTGVTKFFGMPTAIIRNNSDHKEYRFHVGATLSNTPGTVVKVMEINVQKEFVICQDSSASHTWYLRDYNLGMTNKPLKGIAGPGGPQVASAGTAGEPGMPQQPMPAVPTPPGVPEASKPGETSPTVPPNYDQPLGSFSESQIKAGIIVLNVDEYVQRRYRLNTDKGMLVYKLQKLGAGDKAGLLGRDVITSIDGVSVVDKETFNYGLNKGYIENPGAIPVTVNRNNEVKSFTLQMK